MSSNNSRYGSAFSRESDASDDLLIEFKKSLEKSAVEPMKNKSIYDQISAIINKKSKFPSVEAAVQDMQQRSGISAYWEKTSQSNENIKVANEALTNPVIFEKFPMIKTTIENYIRDTKGNMDLPAIIEKIKGIFRFEGPESKDWEDEAFIKCVNKMNMDEQNKYNHDTADYNNLGKLDRGTNEIDPGNTDAFLSLMPVKT